MSFMGLPSHDPSPPFDESPPTDDGTIPSSPSDDGSTPSPPPPTSDSTPSPPPPSDNSSPPPPNSDNGNSTAPSPSHPPPKKSSDGKHKSKHKDSKTDSVITGVAASFALLIFIMVLYVCCSRRKAKKRMARARAESMKYHMNNNNNMNMNMNNNYYKPQNWQTDAPGSAKHNNWHMSPPPPPPPMMTSGSFSGPPLPPPHPMMAMGGYNKSTFSYDDLAAATGGFAQANLLGQGGFGYVHKGVLPNGKIIAVKSLKANSGQGEREFQAEVDIISRVHHRHLVSLVGYCIAGNQRMLVYEFVPNGNLEQHLHGSDGSSMDWPTRLKIALGAAKGFAYLHEDCHPRIIHRDIKAANILVDENFDAKVADFGLAKLSSDTFTHVSTRIMGTFGYLAPEYASTGKLTEKSDCYSYGIMLLELITGRRPIDMNSDDDGLVDWARPILVRAAEGGSFEEMVDPRLGNNYDRQEMLRAMLSAAACIRHSARRRPKMSQIVRALEGDVSLDDLTNGKTPGSAMFGSSGSESDLRGFGRIMSSQEFSTSEDSQDMRANRN